MRFVLVPMTRPPLLMQASHQSQPVLREIQTAFPDYMSVSVKIESAFDTKRNRARFAALLRGPAKITPA